MKEQPKMKEAGKNSVDQVFGRFKNRNNETKLGLDFADPKLAGRKLLCWVVPILIGVFTLCSIIYALTVWHLHLGLMHVEKNNNQVDELNQRLLNTNKILSRATGSSTFGGVLKKNSSNKDVGFSTTFSSIEKDASALSLKATSLHEEIGTQFFSQINMGSN